MQDASAFARDPFGIELDRVSHIRTTEGIVDAAAESEEPGRGRPRVFLPPVPIAEDRDHRDRPGFVAMELAAQLQLGPEMSYAISGRARQIRILEYEDDSLGVDVFERARVQADDEMADIEIAVAGKGLFYILDTVLAAEVALLPAIIGPRLGWMSTDSFASGLGSPAKVSRTKSRLPINPRRRGIGRSCSRPRSSRTPRHRLRSTGEHGRSPGPGRVAVAA